jgi:hypothetical protein
VELNCLQRLVGTGRFELPTPRTPSECSTRLSHVPTRKEPAASHPQRMGLTRGFYHLRGSLVRSDQSFPIVVGLSCFSALIRFLLPFRQLSLMNNCTISLVSPRCLIDRTHDDIRIGMIKR